MIAGGTGRRAGLLALTTLTAGMLVGGLWVYGLNLRPTAWVSGWLLAASVALLALFGVRKRISTFPLGRASTWLDLHLHVSVLSAVLFVAHAVYTPDAGFTVPRGSFEISLAIVYLITAASGVIGLMLSRLVPGRLAVNSEEFIFERLPVYRRELRERAEALVLQAAEQTEATTVPDLYSRRLASFFAAPRHLWHHLAQSDRPKHMLASELEGIRRYLNDRERVFADELGHLMAKKDEVDYARAMQGLLKVWLVAHVAATIALLVFVGAHVIILNAFRVP